MKAIAFRLRKILLVTAIFVAGLLVLLQIPFSEKPSDTGTKVPLRIDKKESDPVRDPIGSIKIENKNIISAADRKKWLDLSGVRSESILQADHRAAVTKDLTDVLRAAAMRYQYCQIAARGRQYLKSGGKLMPSQVIEFDKISERCKFGRTVGEYPREVRDKNGYGGDPKRLITLVGGVFEGDAKDAEKILDFLRDIRSPELISLTVVQPVRARLMAKYGFDDGESSGKPYPGLDSRLIGVASQIRACQAANDCREVAAQRFGCVRDNDCVDDYSMFPELRIFGAPQDQSVEFALSRWPGETMTSLRARYERALRFVDGILAGGG